MPTVTSTISGNAHIIATGSSTISGNAKVSIGAEIFGNAKIVIKKFIDVITELTYDKSRSIVKLLEIDEILDPVPSAPTLLIATDLATGDSVRLDWTTSGAPAYNVFIITPGPVTKVNQIVLGSGETTYIVGGLPTGIAHTFAVRGVNGQDVESGNSNIAGATPTLNLKQSKFTKPTWSVKINSVEDTAIRLEKVRLGYGSDFSISTFSKFEGTASLSDGDDVEIIVNGRSIFKGTINTITDSASEQGLIHTYGAVSKISELENTVVERNRTIGTTFNTRDTLNFVLDAFTLSRLDIINAPKSLASRGITFPFVRGKKNTDEILLNILGFIPIDAPSVFPGAVVLTDQNLLQAAETVLKQSGNFKLFFNFDTDKVEVYQIGSGGKQQRTLDVGKHIVSSNITTATKDIITKVTIFSAPILIRTFKTVPSFGELVNRRSPDGNFLPSIGIAGKNIGSITAEGFQNSPPEIIYDGSKQAIPRQAGFADGFWPGGFDPTTGEPLSKQDASFRPAILEISNFKADWAPLAAQVEYIGTSNATIFFGELAKIWSATTRTATVPVSLNSQFQFQVLDRFEFRRGSLRVFFEFELSEPLSASAGTDGINRVITDTGYRPEGGNLGFSNIDTVFQEMQTRADAELARLSHVTKSGTIRVVGDETLDLRTVVNGMDVLSVTHDFADGFSTSLQLTNEPTITEVIPDPILEFRPENRVISTRDIVSVNSFDIVFIDSDGRRNKITPKAGEQADPNFGPDSPFSQLLD